MELEELRKLGAESVNNRRIIEGERNNLMQVRPLKHQFARDFIKMSKANTWFPEEVDLSEDAKMYATGQLADGEITAYKSALAFLSNLDGIQLNNLTNNINRYITSPEVNIAITRQAWDEALHVESYAHMIETIGFDPIEVYWMFKTDTLLAEKNEYIMESSMLLGSGYTPENFVMAIAANIALEGIYFYSGFLTFYMLARMGKMKNSAKMIKLIQRDEVNHLDLHLNIWHTLRKENPELFTPELYAKVSRLFDLAVQHELAWGKWITRDGLLGATDKVFEGFLGHRCDLRLSAMGMNKVYNCENPVGWFDKFSEVNSEENFFETKVTAYSAGDLEW